MGRGSFNERHNARLRLSLKAFLAAAIAVGLGTFAWWLEWHWLQSAASYVVVGAVLVGFGAVLAHLWDMFRSIFGGANDK
jgi:glycerol-3-phosphate acyltransferase PlsY